MGDAAILKMVEDTFRYCCFIIDLILRGNDSIMQAVINHPSIGAQGQSLNSSKGKLDK